MSENENDKTVYVNNKKNSYVLIGITVGTILLLIISLIVGDESISLAVNAFTQQPYAGFLNEFFLIYTDYLIYIFIVGLFILVLLSFLKIKKLEFLEKWRPALLAGVISWVIDEPIVNGIKFLIARPRPLETLTPPAFRPIGDASGYSFPSGHATAAFASSMPLTFKFDCFIRKSILILYASLMAFSRVYVGVHWATDVLVGTLIGLGISLVVSILYPKIINKFENKTKIELIIWIVTVVLGVLWITIF
ncbi:MAG: phosphatase PAP2 family protein [Candidatus Helarchaeota archaeon]